MTTLEQQIRQSERQKEKNDKTLETATNYQQPWLSDELDVVLHLAGEVAPEEIATEIGRSYHGLAKKAEKENISLAVKDNDHKNNGHQPVQKVTRVKIKVHKVVFTPIMRYGQMVGQKRKEITFYKYADEGEK